MLVDDASRRETMNRMSGCTGAIQPDYIMGALEDK